MTYFTITEIKTANKEAGLHWFSPDTMRFFNSRILRGVIGGRYFVTSERYDHNSRRYYTVRRAHADGSISTASQFQEFATAYQARKAARHLAETEEEDE